MLAQIPGPKAGGLVLAVSETRLSSASSSHYPWGPQVISMLCCNCYSQRKILLQEFSRELLLLTSMNGKWGGGKEAQGDLGTCSRPFRKWQRWDRREPFVLRLLTVLGSFAYSCTFKLRTESITKHSLNTYCAVWNRWPRRKYGLFPRELTVW